MINDQIFIPADEGYNPSTAYNIRLPTPLISKNKSLQPLKNGIWIYFLLLIFEGALRKWVLPGLSTPLLVVRDPIALYLILSAWQRKLLPSEPGLIWMIIIGFLGIFTAVSVGHGSLLVAIYGARILLIHYPLVFVIARVFEREDIMKMGRVLMYITIPMTVLIGLQFYSPQSAWVNRGVGDDIGGAGFTGALGYFRPPGTFSFTTGNTEFYGVVTCFVFYFLLNPKEINRIVLIAATGCLFAAIPLSISRSMFFQLFVTGVFVIVATARKSKYIWRTIFGTIIIFVALYGLSQYKFFQTATDVFTTRLTSANESRGGVQNTLVTYYLGSLVDAIGAGFTSNVPILGYGIGYGTNVGSTFLYGKRKFLVSEGEWGREIGELGPVLGLLVIFIRLSLTAKITYASYKLLAIGDLLPWILLSIGIISISQGDWQQPTSLGFFVIICGLMMASIRAPLNKIKLTANDS
jgi:hypothetical protein